MDGTPEIVLLISEPDLGYARRLANALRVRRRGLDIPIKDIAAIEPIPSGDVSLYVLLLGPDGPPEQRLASLAKTFRRAIADERIVDLASDENRAVPWKVPGHFVDRSDWRGEPDPVIVDQLSAFFTSYISNHSLLPLPESVADNSNILLPDGTVGLNRYLFTRIADIEFSIRTTNSLKNDNIMFVGDLVQKTEHDILRIPNMGRKSLNEIKEVLSSMDLTVGLSPVGWPPENFEHEIARIDAARRAAALEQKPGGATFAANDDHLAMNVAGDESDRETAERPITRQMHDEIKRKAHAFAALAHRLDNQIGWTGIRALGERLDTFLAVPTDQIPEVLGHLYPAALELGSFLEMDNALRASTQSYAAALDIELRRPLEDLVRSFAPWLRGFPSVRQMDDDAGRFLVRQADLRPTTTIIQTARAIDLISEDDAATLHALTEAAARGEFQGEKAAGRVTQSVRNMVYLGASIVGSFFLGSVSSDFATKSVLVQRTGTFLASAEGAILELVADLPHDLRLSISDLVHESLMLPEAPVNPIKSEPSEEAARTGRRPRRSKRT